MARYIYIAFVYSALIIFSVSLIFSLVHDGDATHKLQRQVDGWMVPLKSQTVHGLLQRE